MADEVVVAVHETEPDLAPAQDPIEVRVDALAAELAGISGRLAVCEGMAHTHEGGPDHALDIAREAETAAAEAEVAATAVLVEAILDDAAEQEPEPEPEPELAEPEPEPEAPADLEPDEAPRATHWIKRPVFRR